MIVKINDVKSYDGFERHVEGSIDLDGNNVYEFVLDTYDGFTSIHLIDGEFELNLEDEDDCGLLNIEDGYEVYDFILDDVNFKGYDFIGEDFE
jgi:hypothetical protein